ncbi:MAG: type VI secretion system contractile sheath small subunit [Candidatus Manganitrophus sp.]|nr:type VI secretion system contractile sheath small subunit [Candidatus Manganitrophus sp.]WDT71898.1 MAG: type VI secretion system contractile sheath small subunit [Candidatus Manganitrophus sp.]
MSSSSSGGTTPGRTDKRKERTSFLISRGGSDGDPYENGIGWKAEGRRPGGGPGAGGERRFPLKLLVLAELSPREEQSASFGTGAGRSRVDKETFGAALQSLVGRVSINVPNRLGGGPKEWPITLPIDSIKSFHPDAVVEAVPALRDLLEIRQRLIRLRNREISYENFRTELGQLQGEGTSWGESNRRSKHVRPTRPQNGPRPLLLPFAVLPRPVKRNRPSILSLKWWKRRLRIGLH